MRHFTQGNPYSIRDNAVKAGTWFVDPEQTADWVIAFLVCPHCGAVSSLSCKEFQISREGVVNRAWACKQAIDSKRSCPFSEEITLDAWTGRETEKLYAIAHQAFSKGRWVPRIDYCHAMNEARARFIFFSGVRDASLVRGVTVGLAVGLWVDDAKGERLSA